MSVDATFPVDLTLGANKTLLSGNWKCTRLSVGSVAGSIDDELFSTDLISPPGINADVFITFNGETNDGSITRIFRTAVQNETVTYEDDTLFGSGADKYPESYTTALTDSVYRPAPITINGNTITLFPNSDGVTPVANPAYLVYYAVSNGGINYGVPDATMSKRSYTVTGFSADTMVISAEFVTANGSVNYWNGFYAKDTSNPLYIRILNGDSYATLLLDGVLASEIASLGLSIATLSAMGADFTALGFELTELKAFGFGLAELKAFGFGLAELKLEFELAELKLEFELAELKLEFELAELKELFTLAELKVEFEIAELKVEFELAELKVEFELAELKLEFELAELKVELFTLAELKVEFELAELKALFTLADLKELFTLAELKELFTLAELKELFTLAELKELFTLAELKELFTLAELVVEFGLAELVIEFGLAELKALFTLAELKVEFELAELKALFTLAELKVEFELAELNEIYTLSELQVIEPDLKTAFEFSELKDLLTVTELRVLFTLDELITFELAQLVGVVSVVELKAAGYTAAQLNIAGFDAASIVIAYSLAELITSGIDIAVILNNKDGFNQLGQDIDGEAAGDSSGVSVSMNSEGTRVAIGARNNDGKGADSGSTRVYQYNGTAWVQLGEDIDGEAIYDYSGVSVSMNSEGTRVAIGALFNNSGYLGRTRVYQYNGTAWVQLGQNIDGEAANDNSGWSVSMNSEGSRVAIGAFLNDGNGTDSGSTRVYEYNVSTSLWVKLGQDIDGEAANDQSGRSVSMNAAGSRVAIGAIYNDGNGNDSGSTRVYEYNVSTSLWVKLGQDIDGEAANDWSGYSVSMNSEGTRVAIGARINDGNGNNSGSTRVYEYNVSTSLWVQLGQDIDGEAADDQSGWSVSMNAAGSRVAIGAAYNDGNGTDSGSTRVYEYNVSTSLWVKFGQDIDGEANYDSSGYSVSMNAAGSRVAIGARFNDGNGNDSGSTRVYQYGKIGLQSLKLAGFTATQFKADGFTATQLKDQGFTATQLKAAGFTATQLKDAGFTMAQLNDAGFTATQLKDQGFTLAQLKDAGFTVYQLYLANFTLLEIVKAGYTLTDIQLAMPTNINAFYILFRDLYGDTWNGAIFTLQYSLDSGVTYSNVPVNIDYNLYPAEKYWNLYTYSNAPFGVYKITTNGGTYPEEVVYAVTSNRADVNKYLNTTNEIIETNLLVNQSGPGIVNIFNFEVEVPKVITDVEFTAAGITLAQLKDAGFTLAQLKDAGFTLAQLTAAGFTATQLTAAGFTATQLKDAGFTMAQLKDAGFTAAQLNIAGFDAASIVIAYSLAELITSGIDIAVILNNKVGFNQLGQDIDGEASSHNSGWSVSMNSEGTRVAIGAANNTNINGRSGSTRVYEYNVSTSLWVQFGQDIDGEAIYDYSGWSVSMNAAGTRVAIGARNNDGKGGADSGSTRVYEYNVSTSLWVQLGEDIDGETIYDYSGGSVSMNSEGTRVAIGALCYNSGYSGRTRVYQYNGTAWVKLGQNIDGEAYSDQSGWSVSMNSEGTRVAIGALYNDGNGNNSGSTRVYEYNVSTSLWVKLGQDIDGEAADDQSGYSVSMNAAGSRVAIGAFLNDGNGADSGHTRVYQYNGTAWVQLGQDIDGEAANDQSGLSVSMNSEGTRVAIGARYNSDNGSTRVYEYNVSTSLWVKFGQDIDGEAANDHSGYSVSMNAAGSIVAIGALLNDGNGYDSGSTRVYQYGKIGLQSLKLAGFTATQFKAAGFTATQLKDQGFTATQLKAAGFTATQLKDAGFTMAQLKDAGFTATQLKDQGFTLAQLKDAGFTAAQLKDAGFTAAQLKDAGFTAAQLKDAGFTATQLKDAGFTLAQLKDAGFTAAQLKDAGFTAAQLNIAGLDAASIVSAYSLAELVTSGIDMTFIINTKYLINQLGQDIDGEAANDYSGYSCSMNAAGTRVAFGAIYNDGNGNNSGSTRVYEYNVSTSLWVKLGQDIDGEAADDLSGYSVSMNSEGTRVAIGARNNDGNGTNSGSTRVYEYNVSTSLWVQLGQDIDGEAAGDSSGYSVSMNSEGSRVAIGAILNGGNGQNSGHTRVYEYNVSTSLWVQFGQDIDGENTPYNYSGYSVSMNSKGTRVAIGAANNTNINGQYSGSTRVYEYNVSTSLWVQFGQDIYGEAGSDWIGTVSMNAAGTRVAIGATGNDGNGTNSGSTRVYEYNVSTSLWVKLGQDIDGEAANDQSGNYVSMNAAGSRVAIGARNNDGNGNNSGHTRVYEYNVSTSLWVKLGHDIDGEAANDNSGRSVSMNSEGTRVAIGALYNDGNGNDSGSTRVYEYSRPTLRQLIDAGFTLVQLKDAGFTATQLKDIGFTLAQLKDAGFTAAKLKDAGFTAAQLNIAGFDAASIVSAYSLAELVTSGIDMTFIINTKYLINQLGQDIDGEAAYDNSGRSAFSMNSEGTRVAIGARYNDGKGADSGSTRVYQYNGTAWVKLGQDIDGEAADDNSGVSVSMNSEGSRVAIGARNNDGNGNNSGHTRVYQYNGTAWVQLGQDIDGEAADDISGFSVSMNSEGTRVAIGAFLNGGNGNNSGSTRVYEYNVSTSLWVKLGQDIDGEAAGDYSGLSVSMNAAGSRVAIGALYNDGNGTDSGHTRVYQYNGTAWVQLGQDIDGEAAGDNSGYSVSMNSEGTRVAIGAPSNDGNGNSSGSTRVYEYNVSTSLWVKLGQDIDGEAANDESGRSVSMNSEGTRVAIGALFNDGNGNNSGHTRVYEYNVSTSLWVKLGQDIDGEAADDYSGWSVSMNAAGSRVAIGAAFNDGNGNNSGHTRVYEYSRPTLRQFIDAGFTLAHLNNAEIPLAELVVEFELAELAELFTLAELVVEFELAELAELFTLAELAELFTLAELVVEFELAELVAAEFTIAELVAAEFTIAELVAAGSTAVQFRDYGFTIAQLLSIEFNLSSIITAFTAIELRSYGYTLLQLKQAGATIFYLKPAFTVPALRVLYTLRSLNKIYTLAELNTFYTLIQLNAEFTLKELNTTFTLTELRTYFSFRRLNQEFTIKQLAGTFTIEQLLTAFTLTELNNGISLRELYNRGVLLETLASTFGFLSLNVQFTLVELDRIFTYKEMNKYYDLVYLHGKFSLKKLATEFSLLELKTDGVPLHQFNMEYTLRELLGLFTLQEMHALYDYTELNQRFTLRELATVFTLEELHTDISFRILNGEYTLRELATVFTLKELSPAFTFAELYAEFTCRELASAFTLDALPPVISLLKLHNEYTLRELAATFGLGAVKAAFTYAILRTEFTAAELA
jgi:uncharacterized protein YjbI with pentapeptide repeats